MSQDSEDEVWEQIIANAEQLSFGWGDDENAEPSLPKDKLAEKVNNDLYCTCSVKYPVPVQSFSGVYYTCSKNGGRSGCGLEIKDHKP